MIEGQSPYIARQHRLADLVAAIQVMGSYKYSGRKVESWAKILGEKPKSADSWLEVFKQHPEFFRAGVEDSGYQTLALRRAQPKIYNTRTREELSAEQLTLIPQNDRSHISRRPLSSEQILSLIDVAVKLHTQAIARRQELRWWVVMLIGLASSFVGAFVAALIKG
ncbi:hypothetical protein [Pseudomonas chlororaphis]|uniref:hypothetical protein n=1 Tax=Pseudomonas chlororaphis TaxID=587753 RepID=UPI00406D32B9